MRTWCLALLLASGCDAGPRPSERVARVEQANLADRTADSVFGQPSLNLAVEPKMATTSATHTPVVVATSTLPREGDVNPVFWIADPGFHRVVGAFSTDSFAQYLAGQYSYNQQVPNLGGAVSQLGLKAPSGVAYWNEQVAIADTGNHRVLIAYRSSGIPLRPYAVFGQLTRFDLGERNAGGAISAETLAEPSGLAFDATFMPGRLFVADTGNHRVLAYSLTTGAAGPTGATHCYGQDDCTKGLPNRGGATIAAGFLEPRGLATDNAIGSSLRGFYVADTGNHRVLHYPVFGSAPDLVYGQGGDFTSAEPSKGGISAASLRSPSGVVVDPLDGSIYVADTGHHRVLHFPKGSQIADRVLGQPDFNSGGETTEPSATRMRNPTGVAVTPNELFVADSGFRRVLRFRTCDIKCDDGNPCTDDSCDAVGNCRNLVRTHPKACAPYFCDNTTRSCARPCDMGHPCQAPHKCINGTCAIPCVSDVSCASVGRACVDGYCCDRACGGPCERCNEAGNEGSCTPMPEGQPQSPRVCSSATNGAECGLRCNGVDGSRCAIARAGTACGTESCSNDVVHKRGVCDGSGACSANTSACAPYGCDVNACRTSCRFDFDCAAGAVCSAGDCVNGIGGAGVGGGCAYDPRANAVAGVILLGALAVSVRRRRR